jgi:hypothetical protein
MIIVPPQCDNVLRRAIEAATRGKWSPTVMSIDVHLSYRVFFASIDFKQSRRQSVLSLLSIYNQLIAESQCGEQLLIDLPSQRANAACRQGDIYEDRRCTSSEREVQLAAVAERLLRWYRDDDANDDQLEALVVDAENALAS